MTDRARDDSFDTYQRDASRTANPTLDADAQLLDAAAGLAEESGEVLALIRKHVFQRRPLHDDRLRDELGDALWCIAALATARRISLGDIARRNVEKLRERHPTGFSPPPERTG
ncbi:MAG: hypothetical protein MNPFHGCM_01485 [Gemmatimonadaceae bacterium]|nr:hypothetical protein [Gemmatimonadaceae bacterium]